MMRLVVKTAHIMVDGSVIQHFNYLKSEFRKVGGRLMVEVAIVEYQLLMRRRSGIVLVMVSGRGSAWNNSEGAVTVVDDTKHLLCTVTAIAGGHLDTRERL